jgi:hypothetical protein
MDGHHAHAVLGVSRHASPAEIKRAFRARALATHPDRGGRRAEFEQLVAAVDTLCPRSPRRRPRPVPTADTPAEGAVVPVPSRPANPFAQPVRPHSSWTMYDSPRVTPPRRPPTFDQLLQAALAG